MGPRVGGSNPSPKTLPLINARLRVNLKGMRKNQATDTKNRYSPKSVNPTNSRKLKPEDIIKEIPATSDISKGTSLFSLLKNINLTQVLVLRSESMVRMSRFSGNIQNKLSALIPSLETEIYQGPLLDSEKNISPLIFSLKSQGLFSNAKIIIVKNSEILKANILNRILDNLPPSPEQILILQYKGEKAPALEVWKKIIAKGTLCDFPPFDKGEIERWINQEAKKSGTLGVDKEGIRWLLSQQNIQIDQLDSLLEKACLLTDTNKEINLDTLQQLFNLEIEADTFQLFSHIAKKDLLVANLFLKSILDSGSHPLMLSGFFNKAIKGLLADSKTAKAVDAKEHAPDLKNAWFLGKLSRQHFPYSRLRSAIKTLAELDNNLKGKNIGEDRTIKSKLLEI